MEQILDAPVTTERKLNYAGFWIRVGAYIIDGIILSIVNYAIAFIFIADYSFGDPNLGLAGFQLALNLIYFAAMESSTRQATLGKMAVGIRVGDSSGEQISFGVALGRYILKLILSIFTLTISLMWAGWDEKKQTLHDKVVNTYVYYA